MGPIRGSRIGLIDRDTAILVRAVFEPCERRRWLAGNPRVLDSELKHIEFCCAQRAADDIALEPDAVARGRLVSGV